MRPLGADSRYLAGSLAQNCVDSEVWSYFMCEKAFTSVLIA